PILAREQAASKGPWFQHPDWTGRVFSDEPFNVHIARFTSTAADANAAFVAGARQDVPALIAEVARLREENARLTTELTVEYNPAAAPKTIIQLAQHVEPEWRQFYEDETGGTVTICSHPEDGTVRIFTSY